MTYIQLAMAALFSCVQSASSGSANMQVAGVPVQFSKWSRCLSAVTLQNLYSNAKMCLEFSKISSRNNPQAETVYQHPKYKAKISKALNESSNCSEKSAHVAVQ